MPKLIGDAGASRVPVQQADAAISQANPVSATLYDVLPTPFTWTNVRILGIAAMITFAVGAPNPLEVVVTIDGQTIIFTKATPSTATAYAPYRTIPNEILAAASQPLIADWTAASNPIAILEGRSVRVQVRVTWAVNQPTPLVCRVKWARFP